MDELTKRRLNKYGIKCSYCGEGGTIHSFQKHIVIKDTDSQEKIESLAKTFRCPKCLNLFEYQSI